MNITEVEEVQPDEYVYILPLIVILGLSGNIISLVTIFHSRLRNVNANVYLIVLTSADSVFLFGILLVCFKVDFIAYEYCVGLEYVLMTASYISSWSTAALTIERYLAIAHPLKHVRYDHVNRVRMIAYWVPIPFVLQLFQFISLKPIDGDDRKCALKEANYQIIAQAVDTVLCYLLPCLTIVVLNILVVMKLRRSTFMNTNKQHTSRRQGGQTAKSGSLTRILWVMPLVFVVLNTPFYVIMMIEVFSQVVYHSSPEFAHRSQVFIVIYNTAHYLYYINTAIDVVVYAFSSANFRKTAVIAWRRILCPNYVEKHRHKVIPWSSICLLSTTKWQEFCSCLWPNRIFSRQGGHRTHNQTIITKVLITDQITTRATVRLSITPKNSVKEKQKNNANSSLYEGDVEKPLMNNENENTTAIS